MENIEIEMECIVMNEAFWTIIGVIIGGIVTHFSSKYFFEKQYLNDMEKDEGRLLFDAMMKLMDCVPISDYKTNSKTKHRVVKCCYDLAGIAIRIKSKKYRKLAIELTQFALDDIHRNDKYLEGLIQNVQIALNEPLIKEYELESTKFINEVKQALKDRSNAK